MFRTDQDKLSSQEMSGRLSSRFETSILNCLHETSVRIKCFIRSESFCIQDNCWNDDKAYVKEEPYEAV